MSSTPSEVVLAGFGACSPVLRVSSGQETTWRAGPVILKPLDMTVEALEWQADAFSSLTGRMDVRLSTPRRAVDGSLVVDGWTAWEYLEGTSEHAEKWDEVIRAGEIFAGLVEGISRPAFLDSRQDPWAIADRMAWGTLPPDSVLHVRFIQDIFDILKLRPPINEPCQLIHGDLTGNVLLSETGGSPAVIDISPYWRPRTFQTAIVVADALTWEGATTDWAKNYLQSEAQTQAFLRALVFRIVSDYLRSPLDPISDNYVPCVDLIKQVLLSQ